MVYLPPYLMTWSMVGRIDSRKTTLFKPRLLKIDITACDTMLWWTLRLASRWSAVSENEDNRGSNTSDHR